MLQPVLWPRLSCVVLFFFFFLALWFLLRGVHVESYMYLAPCFHVVSVLFSIVMTSLWEERTGLYLHVLFVFLFLCCFYLFFIIYFSFFFFSFIYFFVFFSSSWCRGLAADCGCGTALSFPFLRHFPYKLLFIHAHKKWKKVILRPQQHRKHNIIVLSTDKSA